MSRSNITLQDIAGRAGVSKMTVSAVLSGRTKNVFVSEATRQRVLALADEMGYRPNVAARALSTGRTNVVEFWAQNVNNPYFNAVFHAARRHLLAHDLSIALFEASVGAPALPGPAWPSDGTLVFDCPWRPEKLQERLDSKGAAHRPYVTLGTYHDPSGDYVAVDLYPGVVNAVEHLLARSRRRVAYLVDLASNYPEEVRCRAYADTTRFAGAEPDYLVSPDNSRATTRVFMREYVRTYGCPDGLFCHNDLMAVGAYRGLCDLGIRVPDDVMIVGCDGIEELEYLECPISTVSQPVEEMCELASRFLHARIEEADRPPQQQVLKAQLVVRQSSGG
jgi:LacI family transcriptional regulator